MMWYGVVQPLNCAGDRPFQSGDFCSLVLETGLYCFYNDSSLLSFLCSLILEILLFGMFDFLN